MARAKSLLCGLMLGAALPLLAVNGPTDWAPVSTNGIAAWRRDHQAPKGVVVDAARHAVTFLAEATGLEAGGTVEFFVCGPLSDRSYESMFMSLASPADIAAAVDSVGVPRGLPVDAAAARYWAQGERMEFRVRPLGGAAVELADILVDRSPEDAAEDRALSSGVVYTGGERAPDGSLVASTNIPCAVMAMYNHAPSQFQLPATLEQSVAYGRFAVKKAFKEGELVEITVAWNGERKVREWVCEVGSEASRVVDARGGELFQGTFAGAADFIRNESKRGVDIYLKIAFAPETSVALARGCAQLFAGVDGTVARLNGCAKGQLFVKAYLPNEKWLNRAARMAQPFEIRPEAGTRGKFTFVEEDWSGESLDPVLKPHESEYVGREALLHLVNGTGKEGEKMMTAFIYLPPGATVGPALETGVALWPRISYFYVFEAAEAAKASEADAASGK